MLHTFVALVQDKPGVPTYHAFATLNLPEIVSVTVPTNTASRRVMQKLGMAHPPVLTFNHPRVPAIHPYRRHVLYSLHNPA